MNKVLLVVLFSILFSGILYYLPNKSNINDYYIIPLIVALLIKYIFGDWDKGSSYSFSDIIYFLVIFCVSFGTLHLIKN